MSLEAALAETTAAVKELTAALKEANEGRAAAAEAVREAVTGAGRKGRPAGAKDKAKDEPSDEGKKSDTKPAPKPVTIEDFRTKGGEFLNEDEASKPKRKEFVKAITSHFGADKLVEVSADEFGKIIGWFDDYRAGKKVNFSEGEDDGAAAAETDEDEDEIG